MSDVDKLQVAEEAAAQRAEAKADKQRERRAAELRTEPTRPGLATRTRHARRIALGQVHPGDNIRTDLPEIQELALSIREVGLLTPLLVRPWDTDATVDGPLPTDADPSLDHYRLVAGHRRHAALRALVDAGVEEFGEATCEVREGITEAEAYALMLTENVQRVPLEPIQAARALRLLLDLNQGMDAGTLARSLGLRPAWASTHLKLLDLPQEVQDRLEAGDLSVTIADLLRRGQAAGRIDATKAAELARKVASGEITSAQVKQQAGPPPRPNTPAPKTVAAGPDGRPVDPVDPVDPADASVTTWRPLDDADHGITRPATPLTGPSPHSTASALPPVSFAQAKTRDDARTSSPSVSWEDRLDAYLLGRALREWADDDYLDELGIDRVQSDAYAALLGFEERVAAIRHLSSELLERESAVATVA